MNDPKVAVDAILENEFEIDGLKIYPITLGRYALLEIRKSPFIYSDIQLQVSTMLPSIFVMTQDIKELSKYNSDNINELKQKSMIWAEEKDIKNVDKIISAVIKRMKQLNEVSPQSSDDDKKKVSQDS